MKKHWIYKTPSGYDWPKLILRGVSLCAVVAVISTVIGVHNLFVEKTPVLLLYMTAFWAVVPPVWFWIEFHCIYKKWQASNSFEYFAHGQNQAKAVWAGILIVLLALSANIDKVVKYGAN